MQRGDRGGRGVGEDHPVAGRSAHERARLLGERANQPQGGYRGAWFLRRVCLFILVGLLVLHTLIITYSGRYKSVPIMFSWFGRSSGDTTSAYSEHVEDGMLEVRVVKDFYNRLGVV